MPHLRHVEPEKHGQDKRAERDEAVGQDHRAFAIPSVDVDPDDRAQQRLGQHTRNCCQRQHLGRTGLDTHPEDDRVADDRAAEDRGELPAPDDPECLFPVFHACFAVDAKKGGHRGVRRCKPFRERVYLTALTIASNAFGSFIARSARTLRFSAMPLALSLPINCE